MSEALDMSLLRDYITYAKAHYNPKYAAATAQLSYLMDCEHFFMHMMIRTTSPSFN